jgi:hypothetical protein
MIEHLPDPAAGVAAVKVSEKLRHEDVVAALSWIDAVVAEHRKCRLVIEFGDFHGWEARGFFDDLSFHLAHSRNVERIAYVGDRAWEKAMVNLSKLFTPSAIRYFDKSATSDAYAWVTEE